MSSTNPYSPPSAEIADVAADAAPRRAPRVFLVLLGLYFVLEVAGAVMTGQIILLARMVILGIAAWRTLQGSRSASFFLGGLFAIGTLASGLDAMTWWHQRPNVAVPALLTAVYMAVLAAYTLFSPSMRALYSEGDMSRWRAR